MTDRIHAIIAEALGGTYTSRGDASAILAALKEARIAVVELPEPDSHAGAFRYVAGWDLNEYDAVRVDCFGRVMGVMGDEYSSQEAREYAATLLAAADAAEVSQ